MFVEILHNVRLTRVKRSEAVYREGHRVYSVVISELVVNRRDAVHRDSIFRHDLTNPQIVGIRCGPGRDNQLHRTTGEKETAAGMKRTFVRSGVVVLPVFAEKTVGIDVGVVIDPKQEIVAVRESVAANLFHLVWVGCILVAARQKDFVGQRVSVDSGLDGVAACVERRTEPRAVEKTVIDALWKSLNPCRTLRHHTSRLTHAAFAVEPIFRVRVDEVIVFMTSKDGYKKSDWLFRNCSSCRKRPRIM